MRPTLCSITDRAVRTVHSFDGDGCVVIAIGDPCAGPFGKPSDLFERKEVWVIMQAQRHLAVVLIDVDPVDTLLAGDLFLK